MLQDRSEKRKPSCFEVNFLSRQGSERFMEIPERWKSLKDGNFMEIPERFMEIYGKFLS